MDNLLKETIRTLEENSKSEKDVLWVGTDEWFTSWGKFKELSDFEYDDGFGGEQINLKLKIVGEDFWLERHEYDGSEWWEFKSLPQKPNTFKEIIPKRFRATFLLNKISTLMIAHL